jgi:hypothetical protein
MKYVLPRNMAAAAAIVYMPPEHAVSNGGSTVYTVRLADPVGVDARFAVENGHIQPDVAHQPAFQRLQAACLEALVENRMLFKHPPSLASLAAITPNWGCVYKSKSKSSAATAHVEWSPYMLFDTSDVADMRGMSYAQLVLKALRISRSSIQPVFGVKEVAGPAQIEIDWAADADSASQELEEVSDIPAAASGGAEIHLRNLAREKMQAKERVRAAYRAADALAEEFYQTYDVSDAESAFSEWERSEDEEGGGER